MNDQQRDSLLFDVTIEGDAAKALLHSLSPDPENGECTAIRLQAGNGHEGYGIYVSDDEYPEEGSMFLAALTQPQAQQASAVPAVSIDLIHQALQDAAAAALSGVGVPFKRVDELAPQVLELVKELKSYKALTSAAPPAPVLPLSAWLPIESAPKDGSLFLCWVEAVRYGETDEGQQYQQDVSQVDFCQWRTQSDIPDCGWFDPCCGQIGDQQGVTHWQPLPAPPITAHGAVGE